MASNAFILADSWGGYWKSYLNNALDVRVEYAPVFGATASVVTVTGSADCSTPRLCLLPSGRMLLTYTRPRNMTAGEAQSAADPSYVTTANIPVDFPVGINGVPAVYERVSDDFGATWNTETLLTNYGLSPTPVVDGNGTLLRCFLRSQNFPYGPYGAQPSQYSPYGQLQYPGDASPRPIVHFGPFTGSPGQPVFPRITAPQVYGLCYTLDRWWMHWPLASSGQTGLFHSTDDGATWAQGRLPRAAVDGGNVKLGLAADDAGGLLLWTVQDQTMSASQIVAGYIGPGQVFSDPGVGSASFGVAGLDILVDQTGGNFIPGFEEDVSFSAASELPGRFLMSTRVATDVNLSDWYLSDFGKSATRL